jgi:preprotein translocase subunit YajC
MLTIHSNLVLLADGSAAGGLGGLLPIILMFAVIYFIVLRPMSKQEKERKKRVETLKKGDEVVLQGGIYGRITNTDDAKYFMVEIAERVRVKVLKSKVEDLQENVLKAEKDVAKAKPEAKDSKDAKKDEPEAKAEAKPEPKKDAKPKKDEAAAESSNDDQDARKGA